MSARLLALASLASVAIAVPLASLGCGSRDGDPPSNATPSPLGSGNRIKQVADPTLPTHPPNNASVTITGATFLWIDTFDETHNGKSKGTVFVQDVGSTDPYSGMSIFSPTYNPADLKPSPGDVLDLAGTYQENASIGSAVFPAPDVLPQISKPTVKPRFEYVVPPPRVVDPSDLNDYAKGRQWMWMLVTIQNPAFHSNLADDGNGRDTAWLTATDPKSGGVALSNELFDVATWNSNNGSPIANGKTIKSITGIVTWFYSYHVAPRTPDDIQVQ